MMTTADEHLLSALWQLDGFMTVLRWPVTVKGNYSDIDVIGVRADGVVRFAECKATGGPRTVYVVKDSWACNFVEDWLEEWAESLGNIRRIWSKDECPKWLPPLDKVKEFSFWFCANLWFPDDNSRKEAERDFNEFVRKNVPVEIQQRSSGKIISTRDVLIEVVRGVRLEIVDEEYGRRFGDPILDIVREMVRYAYPQAVGGGVGVSKVISEETEKKIRDVLWGRKGASHPR